MVTVYSAVNGSGEDREHRAVRSLIIRFQAKIFFFFFFLLLTVTESGPVVDLQQSQCLRMLGWICIVLHSYAWIGGRDLQ